MKKLGLALLKIFVGLVVVLGLAGGAIWQGGWGAIEESHPALASQELVPLIPIRDFFANTSGVWGYRLSPDGKWLSWEEVEGTAPVVRVRAMDGSDKIETMQMPQGTRYQWHPDSIGLLVTTGNRYTRLRTFFADTRPGQFEGNPKNWSEITPKGKTRYFGKALSGDEPWAIISDDRKPGRADVFTVGADGVGLREIRRNDGTVFSWLLDGKNNVVGRFVKLNEVTYAIEADPDFDDRNWRALGIFTVFDTFHPFVFNDDHWIAISNRGRDHIALVRVDLETGQETVIHENESKSVDNSFALSRNPEDVDYVLMGGGEPEYIALSEIGEKLLAALSDVQKPYKFDV